MSSRLSPEDQQKVEQYLASPLHQVERAPFRPWFLMFVLLAVVIGLACSAASSATWPESSGRATLPTTASRNSHYEISTCPIAS